MSQFDGTSAKSVSAWKQVLAWLAFLPVSFLAACVASYSIEHLAPRGETVDLEDMGMLRIIGSNIAWGVAFVWVGTAVAPKCKLFVSVILACVSFFFFGLPAVVIIKSHRWMELAGPLMGMTSAIVCSTYLIKEQMRQAALSISKNSAPPSSEGKGKAPESGGIKTPPVQINDSKLCSCAQTQKPNATMEGRYWPGTHDTVIVDFCADCKKPLTEEWACEPEYTQRQAPYLDATKPQTAKRRRSPRML